MGVLSRGIICTILILFQPMGLAHWNTYSLLTDDMTERENATGWFEWNRLVRLRILVNVHELLAVV